MSQPLFIMVTMDHDDDRTIECATCPATGTTACGDCIVTHLLANDDGPIEYAPIEYAPTARAEHLDGARAGREASGRGVGSLAEASPESAGPGERSVIARAMRLFADAGLLDDPPQFVPPDVFADGRAMPAGAGSAGQGRAR